LDCLQKYADGLVVKPEDYYHNWPPPPQRVKEEIERLTYSSDLYLWIEALAQTDLIFTFCDPTPLAGCGGYVALRDGKQISVYEEWVS
jgi:hypothetical protein